MAQSIEEKRKFVTELQEHYDNLRKKHRCYLNSKQNSQIRMERSFQHWGNEDNIDYKLYKNTFEHSREMLRFLEGELRIAKRVLKVERDELSVMCQSKKD